MVNRGSSVPKHATRPWHGIHSVKLESYIIFVVPQTPRACVIAIFTCPILISALGFERSNSPQPCLIILEPRPTTNSTSNRHQNEKLPRQDLTEIQLDDQSRGGLQRLANVVEHEKSGAMSLSMVLLVQIAAWTKSIALCQRAGAKS
jgi:hypothetical protein